MKIKENQNWRDPQGKKSLNWWYCTSDQMVVVIASEHNPQTSKDLHAINLPPLYMKPLLEAFEVSF